MTLEEFKKEVLSRLRVYAGTKPEEYLSQSIEEFPDIIADGYNHYRGVEYGCDYAAWNISQCI